MDANSQNQATSIVLIDDHAIIRAAFQALLDKVEHFHVVGAASDARSGIELVGRLHPNVAVLDIAMPGLSGLDAIQPLKEVHPDVRVLMASQHEGGGFVRSALESGADGYLSKDSDPSELQMAIEVVMRGDSFVSPKVAGSLVAQTFGKAKDASPLSVLTPREREVFQLLAVGRANKEIAAHLELAVGTVKKHRENLQRKLDCHSPAELARLAIREGLMDP